MLSQASKKLNKKTMIEGKTVQESGLEEVFIDDRPCRILVMPVTGNKITVVEYWLRGEEEDVYNALLGGSNISKDANIPFSKIASWKNKGLEYSIKAIELKNGEKVDYSKAWWDKQPAPDTNIVSEYITKFLERDSGEEGKD